MYKSSLRKYVRVTGLVFLGLFFTQALSAHTVVNELEKMSGQDAAMLYLELGYTHILPLGLDHILFVVSLYLLSPKLKPVLWQATAFTIAHSVTLGLSMYHIIKPPSNIVEPAIALSIMYVALENILSPSLKKSRIGIIFLFGLVHGMGFASALGQLGLPQTSYLTSILMFNLGVEFGQLTVIISVFLLLGTWLGKRPWYRIGVVIPLSAVIAIVAGFWTIQRLFL